MTNKNQQNILINPSTKINSHISTIFLIKNYITKPKIFIGDYTYYHDFNGEQVNSKILCKFKKITKNEPYTTLIQYN